MILFLSSFLFLSKFIIIINIIYITVMRIIIQLKN